MKLTPQQQEDIERYNERKAEIAKAAKLAKAAPAAPRQDEWSEVPRPIEERSGLSNPEATGPKTEWKTPVGGKLVFGPGNVGRVVPDPAPATAPVEAEPQPRATAPQQAQPIQGTRVGTSGIGMRTLPGAAPACGPAPVQWIDPKKGI